MDNKKEHPFAERIIHSQFTDSGKGEKELKETKEAAGIKETWLKNIFDSVQSGIIIIDPESHTIVDINSAAAKMFGNLKENIIGSVCYKYICPEETGKCPITDLKQKLNNSESVLIKADGNACPVIKTVTQIQLDERTYLLESIIDNSSRKQAENDLKESEKMLWSLIDSSNETLLITSTEGTILLANETTAKRLGKSIHELIGTSQYDHFPPDVAEYRKEQYNKVARTGKPIHFEDERAGGIYEIFAYPIIDDKEKVSKIAIFARDITQRKIIEKALKKNTDRLEKVNACLLALGSDYISNIQHLTALCGELLGATCALYNHYENGVLFSLGQWQVPPDYNPENISEGYICYDVIRRGKDGVILIRNLSGTSYAESDPNVRAYNLQTYLGHIVKCKEKPIGSICTVYREDYIPTEDDIRIMGIIASAIGNQEIRKQVEEEFRESEEKFRRISASAYDPIIMMDDEGNITFWNEAAEKVFGYSNEEIMGKECHIILAPQRYHSAYKNGFNMFKTTGHGPAIGRTLELEAIRKDGTEFQIELSVSATQLKGRWTAIGVIRDITERKRAEKALCESEEKYRSIFNNAVEGIFQTTPDGCFISANPALAHIHGYSSPEELINTVVDMNKQLYVDDNYRTEFISLMNEKGSVHNFEARTYRKDGKINWISIDARNVRNENGESLYFEGTIEDITDRRKAEEALRESEERYRTAIENSNDGVAIMRGEEHLYVNKKFVEIFGYTDPDEITGKTIFVTVHPDDIAMVSEISRHRQIGEPVPSRYEFTGIKKDGTPIFIEVSATKTIYLGETVSLVYLRDITERKHLQYQLFQSQKMEAIGTLAGGIAHDFNNIITALIGYGSLLRMQMEEEDPLNVYVNQILSSSEKAANLTQKLLAFSRKQVIEPKLSKVNSIIEGMVKLLKRLLTEDIEIQISYAHPDINILADVSQMDQVLMNLATNARDAMPGGGTLTIVVKETVIDIEFVRTHGYGEPGRYAMISVMDTGIGIDEKIKDKIFEPFFTTKEIGKGTGLGLSIIYGIVKQHNGYIDFYSEPDQGTTFQIYIPVIKTEIKETENVSLNTKPGTETVLIAEDNPVLRNLTHEILTMSGYTVVKAIDGEDALRKFMEYKDEVALLILDVVMPRKNGKEVYEEIKKVKPDIKALFTSGYTGDVVINKGINDDMVDFISKPLSPNELLSKIREVLDK